MIRFERTEDMALVRDLLTAPGSWEYAIDAAAPERDRFMPNPHPAIWYVLASDELGAIALFTFIPQNAACWEIHASRIWGSRARRAAREVMGWFFRASGARRIVASIPATNRLAIRGARAAGLREFGRNPASFLLPAGQLVDLVLLGISAPAR